MKERTIAFRNHSKKLLKSNSNLFKKKVNLPNVVLFRLSLFTKWSISLPDKIF